MWVEHFTVWLFYSNTFEYSFGYFSNAFPYSTAYAVTVYKLYLYVSVCAFTCLQANAVDTRIYYKYFIRDGRGGVCSVRKKSSHTHVASGDQFCTFNNIIIQSLHNPLSVRASCVCTVHAHSRTIARIVYCSCSFGAVLSTLHLVQTRVHYRCTHARTRTLPGPAALRSVTLFFLFLVAGWPLKIIIIKITRMEVVEHTDTPTHTHYVTVFVRNASYFVLARRIIV